MIISNGAENPVITAELKDEVNLTDLNFFSDKMLQERLKDTTATPEPLAEALRINPEAHIRAFKIGFLVLSGLAQLGIFPCSWPPNYKPGEIPGGQPLRKSSAVRRGTNTLSDIAITFAIVAAVVVLFVWNRIPVVLVALGTALALYVTGVLDLGQALAGLGDPAVIFIASLFVVSAGLEATGVTAWAGQLLIAQAGESRARLLVLMMLLVALLTALISLNGAVAALLPVVVVMAVRLGRPPSQLLMPLVFSAHAGSMLALTGTPVNVLVSEAAVGRRRRAVRLLRVRHRRRPAAARHHGDHRAVRRSACCRTAAAGRCRPT